KHLDRRNLGAGEYIEVIIQPPVEHLDHFTLTISLQIIGEGIDGVRPPTDTAGGPDLSGYRQVPLDGRIEIEDSDRRHHIPRAAPTPANVWRRYDSQNNGDRGQSNQVVFGDIEAGQKHTACQKEKSQSRHSPKGDLPWLRAVTAAQTYIQRGCDDR